MKTVVVARLAPIPPRKPDAPGEKEIRQHKAGGVAKAADILQENHPMHAGFVAWCKGATPTKRKAREFCRLMHIGKAA